MKKEEYNYWLSNIKGIGNKKRSHLLKAFNVAEKIYMASSSDIKSKTPLSDRDIDRIIKSKNEQDIKDGLSILEEKGIDFISIEDKRYPSKLKEIHDPPFALYIKGELPPEGKKSIAIVGARDCSLYGKEVTKYLATSLSAAGIPIISGLARGIDSHAHVSALRADGKTYGILGCGIDVYYPRENFNLYRKMEEVGGVISEYGLGVNPHPGNFPMRNRIISGITDAVLVIEARKRSGSLITVDMGLDQGKDIYSVPGRIGDKLSEGCNELIKMGAKPVTSPDDILEDLIYNYDKTITNCKNISSALERKEKVVYACLGFAPKHIEEISRETEIGLHELGEIMLKLEISNLIEQTIKNFYVANK